MIVAVDPGGTTGVAMKDGGTVGFSQHEDWKEVPASPWLQEADVIVVERYIVTPQTIKKSRQYDALYLIGTLCYIYGEKIVFQAPAEAKRFSSDIKLQRLGWYSPGKGHANDAARHLLLYCIRNKIVSGMDVL